MNDEINVVIFDLFFTLVTPSYSDLRNENDVLGIARDEWEKYAEDMELYIKRASGKEKDPERIIEDSKFQRGYARYGLYKARITMSS